VSALELRDVALNPSQGGRMRDIGTALSHDLDQITIAELVSEIPFNTEYDDGTIKVAATE
jgi:hypothetical protein